MEPNIRQYLETALWSSIDDDGTPLDQTKAISDVAAESVDLAMKEWSDFRRQAGALLDGRDLTDVAHDFWLTRNRHGAGFWDGDYSKPIGDRLTEIAHSFGEKNAYVGDDGKVYIQ